MPAVGSNVTILTTLLPSGDGGGTWMAVGQVIFISTAGYFSVVVAGNSVFVTVKNLGYTGNASPTALISGGQTISPAGLQGGVGSMNSISPTTTKGDMLVDNGANNPNASVVRLGVGTNGKVLTAKSGVGAGVEWDAVDLTGANTSLSGQLQIASGGTGQQTQQAALNALAPSNPTKGGLIYFNGTNWVELDTNQGSVGQVLASSGASPNTVPLWAWPALIQHQKVTLATYQNAATGVALTGTTVAPTTGVGFQAFTLSFTPKSTTSRVVVRASMQLFTSSSGAYVGIFNNTTLLSATITTAASAAHQLQAVYEFVPGSTSAITFNVYVGTGNAGTTYINGNATAIYFGGKVESLLTVEEYA